MKSRIMYMECKTGELSGEARIGRVTFTKSGLGIRYQGRLFLRGGSEKLYGNYFDEESGAEYWISGCKKDGTDRLFGNQPVAIDEDARDEYWNLIRQPN
ncbi:hypothetical protein LGH70_09380 [Hymenobacter sp. BT635]|uniref:1-deoxy-D-xylulose-5-phosphate synthase n=1 Tax=Hymenobacter nitidus TaxID=2880929 RepID=A0ABS8ABN7_9BACT|nr:hypothetical protein [Hymenobacter nitidus]MCB2377792.1 hypothetical protein [Hymenobacter nitidus]